jgi:hypothetical protein
MLFELKKKNQRRMNLVFESFFEEVIEIALLYSEKMFCS